MRRPLAAAVLLLALLGAPGDRACAGGAAIIVEVNGVPITRADLDEALAMDDEWLRLQKLGARAAVSELRKGIEERVLDSLIDEVLLTEAARVAHVTLTPEEEREIERLFEERVKQDWGSTEALEEFLKARGLPIERLRTRHRNGFLVRKLVQEEAGRTSFVRPADVREYYRSHLESYRLPGNVEISQIVVRTGPIRSEAEARTQIEAAAKALAAGKSFAEVAKGYPDGANYETGGKLTVQSLASLRKDLQDALAPLKEGETSGVIEAADRFMIVRLDNVTADRFKPFEDVQEEIYRRLENEVRLERFEALRRRLRDKAFIKRE